MNVEPSISASGFADMTNAGNHRPLPSMPMFSAPSTADWGPRKQIYNNYPSDISRRERVLGCMLAGAAADSLAGPIEFLNWHQIADRYGDGGLDHHVPLHGTLGAITDETQMTLFTAEALLRVRTQGANWKPIRPTLILTNAYRRWLRTQRHIGPDPAHFDTAPGWLMDVKELWVERSPDKVTLQALKQKYIGTPETRSNDAKGSAGVARATLAGMFEALDPYRAGCEIAAATHGHPASIVSGGLWAHILYYVMGGHTIRQGAWYGMIRAEQTLGYELVEGTLRFAMQRADEVRYAGVVPMWMDVEALGSGHLAPEALAMAVFLASCFPEPTMEAFETAVKCAINHGGNSTIVGMMTAQLLGAMHGPSIIPPRWLEHLELRDVITQMAEDVATEYIDERPWKQRYPAL